MLTPRFSLSQTDEYVVVTIELPAHARLKEGEFDLSTHTLTFHLKPYFLRLTFRKPLVDDERTRVSADADKGGITLTLPKLNHAEHFDDLNLLTELLRKPQPKKPARPLIEVISSEPAQGDGADASASDDAMSELELDAMAVQRLPPEDAAEPLVPQGGYGFNRAYAGVFVGLEDERLVQLPDPEGFGADERRRARLAAEEAAFDADHYIADFIDDAEVRAALAYAPWWLGCGAFDAWNEEEHALLVRLPRKEYMLDAPAERRALCGLVDLLFAYCYDERTTGGEPTVESGWTVRTLSSQLSWLDDFDSVEEAVTACLRRALCFPLLRSWELARRVVLDVAAVVGGGLQPTLRALLRCHITVQRTADYGHLSNRVWLDDYIVWLQQQPARVLERVGAALQRAELRREQTGWPLQDYEALAREAAAEEPFEVGQLV